MSDDAVRNTEGKMTMGMLYLKVKVAILCVRPMKKFGNGPVIRLFYKEF